ncbi:MAG: putative DNA binding domain-containing protein, partial [Mediterranea sp.]|nr:putative DNA binding domain-containing protein [Mediterranea sp.]
MTASEIQAALKRDERLQLEAKLAGADVPKSVWETYSAFANTIGGLILLGVHEELKEQDLNKRFTIVGVSDAKKIITDFWNTINSNKVNQNILKDADVETVDLEGKQVVCIQVPQADYRAKPIYLNDNVYKGAFKRHHEGDFHCTESEIRAMIRDANEDGNDGILIEYYGMDDVDPATLQQYRMEFKLSNGEHIWNGIDDKEFLKNLGGYTIDRRTGKEGLTLAGLLMFGKGLPIRERFSNFRMDYIDMSRLIGEMRYRDRLTYDGLWENNLYQFFRRIVVKLTSDLPRPFYMEGIKRIDDSPLHKAVREALTNSIIHSDYFLSGSVLRIEKYDDRICLRNPGTLKLPVSQIYEGGNSKARNPRMQNMLRMIGFGENLGSGFPKILGAWQKAGWKAPTLKNKLNLDEVELTLYIPFLEIEEAMKEGMTQTDEGMTQTGTLTTEKGTLTKGEGGQTGGQTNEKGTLTKDKSTLTKSEGGQTGEIMTQTDESMTQTALGKVYL